MKKLFALLLVLCMIFSLTACAQLETRKELADAQNELENATDVGDADGVVDALDDYADKAESAGATTSINAQKLVDSLSEDASFKSQLETLKSQGLTCKLEARDNYVAYVYQYTMDLAVSNSEAKATLDTTTESLKSLADSLCKIYTGIDGVIYEYRAKDGSIIATYKF